MQQQKEEKAAVSVPPTCLSSSMFRSMFRASHSEGGKKKEFLEFRSVCPEVVSKQ
jgi:hypothetical protein